MLLKQNLRGQNFHVLLLIPFRADTGFILHLHNPTNAINHYFSNYKNDLCFEMSCHRAEHYILGLVNYFVSDGGAYSDYLPFGMVMPGRNWTSSGAEKYRYAYNGMEQDNEVSGNGNSYTTEFRQYDPRLGRWKSLDPVIHHNQSPYCGMDNNPIRYNDPNGEDVEIKGASVKEKRQLRRMLFAARLTNKGFRIWYRNRKRDHDKNNVLSLQGSSRATSSNRFSQPTYLDSEMNDNNKATNDEIVVTIDVDGSQTGGDIANTVAGNYYFSKLQVTKVENKTFTASKTRNAQSTDAGATISRTRNPNPLQNMTFRSGLTSLNGYARRHQNKTPGNLSTGNDININTCADDNLGIPQYNVNIGGNITNINSGGNAVVTASNDLARLSVTTTITQQPSLLNNSYDDCFSITMSIQVTSTTYKTYKNVLQLLRGFNFSNF